MKLAEEDSSDDGSVSTDDTSIEADSDDGSASASDTSVEDSDDDEDDDVNVEQKFWRQILNHVVDKDADITAQKDDMTRLAKNIMLKVQEQIEIASILRASNVYKQVQKTTKRLIKQGYAKEEAEEAACDMRKFLIKKEIVEPNWKHIIASPEESGDVESGEDSGEADESEHPGSGHPTVWYA